MRLVWWVWKTNEGWVTPWYVNTACILISVVVFAISMLAFIGLGTYLSQFYQPY